MPLQSRPDQLPEISGPLRQQDSRGISIFLRECPGVPLRVIDRELSLGAVGTLCIGIASEVCVALGNDRLAISFHPGRFELTQHSLIAYMAEVRKRAAAVAQDAFDDERIAFDFDDLPADAPAEGRGSLNPREQLKAKLIQALRCANSPRLIASDRAIDFRGCPDNTPYDEICRLARAVGLNIVEFKIAGEPATGISDASSILDDIIKRLGLDDLGNILGKTDYTKTGPYAIALQPRLGRIFIINKALYTQFV